ncbi:5-methyltetrahydropteroyltriglutamate--homocysteine S-methyltransferase [Spirochaeta cellobiosiphila]|uniref:5-methyltetrahydropteroyltriglutamate-- homocysteine S-methyltransferase n=1 Tax=Spirochaeta cellobiosiphila TaxID=504483 RepID=UPI00040B5041|nr:5-methyltetrahydropteroyltriglutamate--homocysteine S-methyltransferase [Spirochaeta cellobiosiphila]
MSTQTYLTGFSRIGEHRELKKALEQYWSGKISFPELEELSKKLRAKHWTEQSGQKIDYISSNDFSYYDTMLDTSIMINAIPERFRDLSQYEDIYFSMARGNASSTAMEMTKWFNTNYHYIVPELDKRTPFQANINKIRTEYREAKELGIQSKINLIGPITYTGLSKSLDTSDPFDYYESILETYVKVIQEISELDDSIILQIDEPILVKDPAPKLLDLIIQTYNTLASVSTKIKIIVMTYFEQASEAVPLLSQTPIWGIGLDFIHGKDNLQSLSSIGDKVLVAGIIDGRNIWISHYDEALKLIESIREQVPHNKLLLSTSCSLLHVPYSLRNEPQEAPIKQWLAFGVEKLKELVLLKAILENDNTSETKAALEENRNIHKNKLVSSLIHNDKVQQRVSKEGNRDREGNFHERIQLQRQQFNLPSLPTTTIGSFPQTKELRKIRRDYKKKLITKEVYESSLKQYIKECVEFQEEIDLDVLVHGEPERNDMVEYFGELLEGFHFTSNGWVQSYGSRCVKPPIIYGDISRPKAMTVEWISYAQSLTKRIMKGMLTGPVTIINWSFVRNDLSRELISQQIALALSDEVRDLQEAGIKIIQVDEAAFKEGYPLRKKNIKSYEDWAVKGFKLTVSTAHKETQIHTHMCYSAFNDIIETIEAMDADVITIETARSGNRLLKVFRDSQYKKEIGPGVYDIHSPRVPSVQEFEDQIRERLKVLPVDQMWVNPDCGLKTRAWEEVRSALTNMVRATKRIRSSGD